MQTEWTMHKNQTQTKQVIKDADRANNPSKVDANGIDNIKTANKLERM